MVDDLMQVLAEKEAFARSGPEYLSTAMHGLLAARVAAVIEQTYWSRIGPLTRAG
jgi:hypothetical protein